jgi:hypothetical protein
MQARSRVLHTLRLAASLILVSCAAAHAPDSGIPSGGSGGLVVSPKDAVLASGGTQAFTCAVAGANATCSWAVREGTGAGSISAAGLYTAPGSGGTYHVVATNNGASAEATVAVTGPAAAVTVTPGSTYLAPGASYTFQATVSGPADKSVTWSVAEGAAGGTVTTVGVYTAPATNGTYHVVATSVANATKSGSASVVVSSVPVVVVSMSPHTKSIPLGGNATFTAIVTGSSDTAVSWSVLEGAAGGSVTSAGVYTAPGTGGTYHVVATSHADSSKTDMATVIVAPFNTWYDVTGSVDATGYSGVTFILVDPVRSSDFYAFAAEKGVWKSTDFGQNWNKQSVNDGRTVASGRPWAAGIDPNPSRDPNTPPTMYAAAGYGQNGLFKSTDGGVNWFQLFTADKQYYCYNGLADVYGMAIEPGNNQHLIVSIKQNWCTGQSATGILESFDGGVTWTEHPPPDGFGAGHYLYFIDSNTWLAVSISFGPAGGTWRTTTAGRKNGVPDVTAWTKVGDWYHTHGGAQAYIDPVNGVIYNPCIGGIYRSTDHGATFSRVYQPDMSGILATPNYLYAGHYYPQNTPDIYYVRSARTDGVNWAKYNASVPAGMMSWGPFWGAVSFDGAHWVMVTPNNGSGVFRYIESVTP